MTSASNAIEEDCRNVEMRTVCPETMNKGGDRLSLVAAVYNENHRQAEIFSNIGGRSMTFLRSVEKAHDAFDEGEGGISRCSGGKTFDVRRCHCPAIEIDTGTAGRRFVETRVDVVRADL